MDVSRAARVARLLVVACLGVAIAVPFTARAQDTGLPDSVRATPPAGATVPDSLSPDSLAARLARAEAAIALLRRQLGVEAQSAVRTRSRFQLELTGLVLTNAFVTSGGANAVDVPLVAVAGTPYEESKDALGLTVRQTRLGAALSVEDVLGGRFEGDIDLDFFGGRSASGGRPLYPEARLRTAHARLIWDRSELMFGSSRPLVSELNPVSVAAVGVPGFVAAGNLWNWLSQVRVTRELGTMPMGGEGGGVRLAIQGAVLAPYAGVDYSSATDGDAADDVDAAERSRRPYLEARLRAQWGEEGAAPTEAMRVAPGGEIGVGIHRGWVATSGGVLHESRALSVDAHVAIASLVELRAEAYTGRLVSGLGGGGIGQSFGQPESGTGLGPPIRDVAGWAQLNVQPHPLLVAGAGCGFDDPDDEDRPTRLHNAMCAAHLLWRPAQPLVLGIEYRQVRTRYAAGTAQVDHLAVAFGVEF